MFLRYLSDHDYEAEYWAFILRLETLTCGFVKEATKHIDRLSEVQARNYFENCFAVCFETDPNLLAPNWWGESVPGIDWFWRWFDREFPLMYREAKRSADSPETDSSRPVHSHGETSCNCHDEHGHEPSQDTDDFDREKIRRYAHECESFRRFLQSMGSGLDFTT